MLTFEGGDGRRKTGDGRREERSARDSSGGYGVFPGYVRGWSQVARTNPFPFTGYEHIGTSVLVPSSQFVLR